MDIERLKETLKRHEGVRTMPYKCTANCLTTGVGHNLDTMPLTMRAIEVILEDDIEIAVKDLRRNLMFFDDLPGKVQEVLVNMAFNLGITRLMQFEKMLSAIADQRWDQAADEALDSRWARQVGNRSIELADVLRSQSND